MTTQDVKKKIIDVIEESTETELELTPDTEIFADMGLSSVEVVVMLGDLEDAFGIDIPAADIRNVRTIGELSDLIIFILKGDKTPTSIGGELQQFSLGGSPISFQDKASGGLQRCADVLCHAKHDAHLAASTPRRT